MGGKFTSIGKVFGITVICYKTRETAYFTWLVLSITFVFCPCIFIALWKGSKLFPFYAESSSFSYNFALQFINSCNYHLC